MSPLPCRLAALLFLALPISAFPQGETTSAIAGQVTDETAAAVFGARVTITNRDTGLQRSLVTDDEGRFNFPQLKPGAYSVKVEAEGFAAQQNDRVFSGLGQEQTVNLTLKIAQSRQTIEITAVPPLINPATPTPPPTSMLRPLKIFPTPAVT